MAESKKRPLVSVVVPVYNCQKYVEQAVNSVLRQPCGDLEVIIVNDGSTDKSEKLCLDLQSKDGRVKYFKKENDGVSSARNFGVENACGEYTAFLDADDVWCKNVYTQDLREKIIKENADIFSFGYIYGNQSLSRGNIIFAADFNFENKDYYLKHISSNFFKKELCETVKFTVGHANSEDREFMLKLMSLGCSLKSVNEILSVYRRNVGSVTRKSHGVTSFPNQARAFCGAYDYIKNHSDNTQLLERCKYEIVYWSLRYIEAAAMNGLSRSSAESTLSEFRGIDFLRQDIQGLTDGEKRVRRMFFDDYDSFAEEVQSKNRARIILGKLGLNNSKLFRRLFIRDSFQSDIREYIF